MMASTGRAYFERIYASRSDPWGFETRWYEQRKYSVTMSSLPQAQYGSAFEPGCSIGVLTDLLAPRCDRLLAIDIVPAVVQQARRRLSRAPHVRVELGSIPQDWPEGTFDLVVLSEIAYYFDAEALGEIVSLVTGSTSPGATVVGAHWRGRTDYPLSGDAAHDLIDQSPSLERVVHHLEAEFVLDVWRRSS